MLFEQIAPAPIAERRCAFTRPDDVREEDGSEYSVRLALSIRARLPRTFEESLNLVEVAA